MKSHRVIFTVVGALLLTSGQLMRGDHKEGYDRFSPGAGVSANSIIGKKVINAQDEKLGSVQDLILNPESGRPAYAVIAVGGSLNPNRHKVAVPFDALQCSPDEKEMMISATREQLESAPKAASGEWAVVNGATWTRNVDAYYGQPVPAERRKVAQKIPPKGAELLSPPQDTVLSEKICESLDVVTVRVQDGVAHIHGTVESDKERQAIESKIRSIQGVSRVESHVKVKG